MPIDNIDLLNEVLLKHTNIEESKKTSHTNKNIKNKTISEILNEREMNVEKKDEAKEQPRLGKTRLRTNTTLDQNQLQNKVTEEVQKSSRMRTRSSIIKPNENSNTPDQNLIEQNAATIVKQLTKGLRLINIDLILTNIYLL